MERIGQVFRLRPEETGVALAMGFLILCNSLARQVTGIVAVSGLLSTGGVNDLLLVLLIDYVIILLTGGLQSLIVDKFNRLALMNALVMAFVLVFVIARLLFTFNIPAGINYTLLYLIAEQQLVFFPLVFWVLGNDIFDPSQAKRLFPFIASWSFVGKIIGSGIAGVAPVLVKNQEDVLLLNVLIYLIAYFGLTLGLRNVKTRALTLKHETVRETLSEGWGFIKEVPSFRYLMLAILALAVCDTIVEFRFLSVSDTAFVSQAAYQQFYSLYRLGVTIASFLVQSFLTSRLIERMNLKNTFFIFPAVVLVGVVGMMAMPGLGTAVLAMSVVKLVRETIDESARKAFQSLVPEERRGRVSTFMDSYLPALGTIVACLLTGAVVLAGLWLSPEVAIYVYLGVALLGAVLVVWVVLVRWPVLISILMALLTGTVALLGVQVKPDQAFYFYLALVALSAGLAIWSVVKMRAVYESSLLNWRLKRRQRGSRVLDKLEF